jgi:hypothetical protein
MGLFHNAVPTPGPRAGSSITEDHRCDLLAHGVRAAEIWEYFNVGGAAVAPPVEKTKGDDDDQGNNSASDSASDSANRCTISAAATSSRTRQCYLIMRDTPVVSCNAYMIADEYTDVNVIVDTRPEFEFE